MSEISAMVFYQKSLKIKMLMMVVAGMMIPAMMAMLTTILIIADTRGMDTKDPKAMAKVTKLARPTSNVGPATGMDT